MGVPDRAGADDSVDIQPPQPRPPRPGEDVPAYTESAPDIQTSLDELSTSLNSNVELPILRWPTGRIHPNESARLQVDIILSFFEAIYKKQDDVIAHMIESNFVTANTTDRIKRTPLLAAVAAGSVRIVQELVDFGAEVDGFGVHEGSERTPLQLAAALGNLTLVKLFVEVYHADDGRIAPDGQLALRLAADNGQREVVEYLPLRRGGGWQRWKTHHAKAVKRVQTAMAGIVGFFRYVLWVVPKFFLWTAPKELLILPVRKRVVWIWRKKHCFLPWCRKQVREMPGRFRRAGLWVWQKVLLIPKSISRAAASTWRFVSKTLPRCLRYTYFYLISLVTRRIPAAIRAVFLWLWNGLRTAWDAVSSVILHLASFLHTLLASLISFFRNITLLDIWNGFCDLVRALFIDLPVNMFSWLLTVLDTSYEVMKKLFGQVGEVLWWIGYAIFWVVMYVPRRIWEIIWEIGGSLVKAAKEIRFWLNPKA